MPALTLRRFARPHVLRSIQLPYLLRLLHEYPDYIRGRELALPPPEAKQPEIDYDCLTRILLRPDLETPVGLAEALEYIHEMSSEAGMAALIDAFPSSENAWGFLEPELTPADMAVRSWLRDRARFLRVHAELRVAQLRRFEYLQTYANPLPRFTTPGADELRPLEVALDAEFDKKCKGKGVRVDAYLHGHDCLFIIRHGEALRIENTLESGGETATVRYRPLKFDAVAYSPRTGALRVHAESTWATKLYRVKFGEHLFGGTAFFPEQGRYSLEPLRTDGSSALACSDVPGLKAAFLTELYLDCGGIYAYEVVHRATDVFAALRRGGKRRDVRLPAGPKLRATGEP